MKTNPILEEIRATRDKLAEETGMDLQRLFAMVKKLEAAAQARGEVVIAAPKRSMVVREDAAAYGGQPGKVADEEEAALGTGPRHHEDAG